MRVKTEKRHPFAKAVRVLTIPPLMVSALLLILWFTRRQLFGGVHDLVFAFLFLGFLPLLAYPAQKLIPRLRNTGRADQRKLAFLFSLISYTGGVIYALLTDTSAELKLVFFTYFLSVILLSACNALLHLRASGHACSVVGPMLVLAYLEGGWMPLVCLAVFCAVVWSSLRLRRHSLGELIAGGLCSSLALVVCMTLLLH